VIKLLFFILTLHDYTYVMWAHISICVCSCIWQQICSNLSRCCNHTHFSMISSDLFSRLPETVYEQLDYRVFYLSQLAWSQLKLR